jgi:SAM-dependent methyltransferase
MSTSLNGLLRLAVMTAASGESQNFLGARWVAGSLNVVPQSWKRGLALRFLAASPHYFYRTKANARLSTRAFLESEYRRCRETRKLIMDGLISNYVRPDFVCLDYGCGPGFLAAATAPKTARVIACDISGGVLACAAAINPAPNIEYRKVAANGAIPVEDERVDLVYSFAVIQHVTDEVLRGILDEFRRVMKPGATVVCHVVLDEEGWKSESDWRADKTLKGRMKWEIGLHCFSRSRESMESMIANAGLNLHQFIPISELGVQLGGDDVERHHLCVFSRAR